MKSVITLENLGYALSLIGDQIHLDWTKEEEPDSEEVDPFIERLREQKENALLYLRARQVEKMTLEEYRRRNIALRIHSNLLEKELWLVSNESTAKREGIPKPYFTADELDWLVTLKPTQKDL